VYKKHISANGALAFSSVLVYRYSVATSAMGEVLLI